MSECENKCKFQAFDSDTAGICAVLLAALVGGTIVGFCVLENKHEALEKRVQRIEKQIDARLLR